VIGKKEVKDYDIPADPEAGGWSVSPACFVVAAGLVNGVCRTSRVMCNLHH